MPYPYFFKTCDDDVALLGEDIQSLYKKPLDGLLVQVLRGAFFSAVKFVIALPDDTAIFII